MKQCKACGEEFENQFSFCPTDGQSLLQSERIALSEFHLTLISELSLLQRLFSETQFVVERFRRAWPSIRRDPIGFLRDEIHLFRLKLRRAVGRPYVVRGIATALAVIVVVSLTILMIEKRSKNRFRDDVNAIELVNTVTIDLKTNANRESKSGVGTGSNGRVGFEKGRGEGSRPTPARAQGGGSGGTNNPLTASQGRVPVPSAIPAPIPTTYARAPQALPAAGIDIDPVLWKDLPFLSYGDPRSKSTTASNGPGEGGGVGTGKGTGIGEGEDNGFGPGKNGNIGGGDNKPGGGGKGGSPGNDPNDDLKRIFRGAELTTYARALLKPEPQYTEEARKGGVTGTVILSVVFSRDGQVTNIRAVQTLCCGLTEKAMAAAKLIRFEPATRNGRAVSTYMQLVYNFNLF
ncbi:MAG TPA: energy transducer TonB [Pyrinomonadaceae bacterium]|nr:energy transducer TonB [Pyrinomonadaceae bacterium]